MKNIKEWFYSEEDKIEIVERLNNNKDLCVKYDFWGNDNHRKMDVFIDIVENNRTEEYIYLNYPSLDDNGKENLTKHSLWSAGIQALEFMGGKTPISDYLYPEKIKLLTIKK